MSKTLCSPLRLQDHRSDSTTACGRRNVSLVFTLFIHIFFANWHLYPFLIRDLPSAARTMVGIQERKGHACSPPSQMPTDGWRVWSGRRGASPPKFDPTKDRYVRFFSSTPLISNSIIYPRQLIPCDGTSTAALLRRRILAEKLSALVALLLGSPSPSGAPGGIGRRALSIYSAGRSRRYGLGGWDG